MNIREAKQSDVGNLSKIAAQTYKETFGHSLTPEELKIQIQETVGRQGLWHRFSAVPFYMKMDRYSIPKGRQI